MRRVKKAPSILGIVASTLATIAATITLTLLKVLLP